MGINDADQIVGVYQDPRSGGTYGFIGAVGSSSFTTVTPFDSGFAGSVFTRVDGINNVGQIVGSYRDPRTGGFYAFLGTPNAPVPEASSVASLGLLLGLSGLGVGIRRRKSA